MTQTQPTHPDDHIPSTDRGYILLTTIVLLATVTIAVTSAAVSEHASATADFISETNDEVDELGMALFAYYRDVGSFPPNLANLNTKPGSATGWMGPYLSKVFTSDENNSLGLLQDAWANSYALSLVGTNEIRIYSFGANRTDESGGGDDLSISIDINAVLWEKTHRDIQILNTAIAAFAANSSNLSSTWSSAVTQLQGAGYLPSGSTATARFQYDAWNQEFVPLGAPKVLSVDSNGPPQ